MLARDVIACCESLQDLSMATFSEPRAHRCNDYFADLGKVLQFMSLELKKKRLIHL